jgi:hypothetical protein
MILSNDGIQQALDAGDLAITPEPSPRRPTEDDEVEKYKVVRIANEIVVDLLKEACGIDCAQASEGGIEIKMVENVPIPVGRKELLIRTKQTERPSDAADVQFLRFRIAAETELSK